MIYMKKSRWIGLSVGALEAGFVRHSKPSTVDFLFSKIQGTKEKYNFLSLHSDIFIKQIGYKEMNVQKYNIVR